MLIQQTERERERELHFLRIWSIRKNEGSSEWGEEGVGVKDEYLSCNRYHKNVL